jgi:hypothetical protein
MEPEKPMKDTRLPIEKVDLSEFVCPEDRNNTCYLLRNVFSISECESIIEQMEALGFNDMGNIHMNRCMVDDKVATTELFNRIKDYLPEVVITNTILTKGPSVRMVGLNERIRCGRYKKGQFFYIHSDSQFMRNYKDRNVLKENFECSALTIMIYLNSQQTPANSTLPSFTGGRTTFLRMNGSVKHSVVPEVGTAIVFTQAIDELTHEGERISSGIKYIYRTDVMYEFAPSSYCHKK